MNAGRLRDRVIVEREMLSEDEAGGSVSTWQTLCETWAEVMPLRGTEALQVAQIIAGKPFRVTMRYRADVRLKEQDRIRLMGSKLNGEYDLYVHSVVDVENRGAYIECICYGKSRN